MGALRAVAEVLPAALLSAQVAVAPGEGGAARPQGGGVSRHGVVGVVDGTLVRLVHLGKSIYSISSNWNEVISMSILFKK